MNKTNWISQEIKEKSRGKSNLLDRFIYFQIEKLRCEMWYLMTNSEGHKMSLEVLNGEIEMLGSEIAKLTDEDLELLKKDSVAINQFNIGLTPLGDWNNLLMSMGSTLETEYTQNEPRISEELLVWQNS